MTQRNETDRLMYRMIYRAYMRDGSVVYTGEALLLACLMHAKGKSRNSDDMKDVRKIMKDANLEK